MKLNAQKMEVNEYDIDNIIIFIYRFRKIENMKYKDKSVTLSLYLYSENTKENKVSLVTTSRTTIVAYCLGKITEYYLSIPNYVLLYRL